MEWVLLLLLIAAGGGAPAVKKKAPGPDTDNDIDIDIDPEPPAPAPAPKPAPPNPNKCTGVYLYPYPWSIDVVGVPSYGLSPAQLSAAKTVLTRVSNGVYNTSMLGGAPCNAAQAIKLSGKPYNGIAEYKEIQALALIIYWKIAGRVTKDPSIDAGLGIDQRQMQEALMQRLRQYVEHATAP